MHHEHGYSGIYLVSDHPRTRSPSLWRRIAGGVVMAGMFALALTVSIALFAVILTVGAAVWGYLWWNTRDLRKAMREHRVTRTTEGGLSSAPAPGSDGARGVVIEGEADVVEEAGQRDRTIR